MKFKKRVIVNAILASIDTLITAATVVALITGGFDKGQVKALSMLCIIAGIISIFLWYYTYEIYKETKL